MYCLPCKQPPRRKKVPMNIIVTRRVNVTLGSGKAVHAGRAATVNGIKYTASPDCGGNRAGERYRQTTFKVTCKRCIKATAARAEMLADAETEAYAEQAERNQRAYELDQTRDLVRHMARRSGRMAVPPVPLTASAKRTAQRDN
jgi:hypothetical protein